MKGEKVVNIEEARIKRAAEKVGLSVEKFKRITEILAKASEIKTKRRLNPYKGE
jgi:hypothetical protein